MPVRREPPIKDSCEVDPTLRLRVQIEPATHASRSELELTVVDAVDKDHTGVGTLCRRPLPHDRREVADVVCHEDTPLCGGKREHVLVFETLQHRLLVECADLVTHLLQPAPHPGARDVRVEQQPHRYGLARGGVVQEGVKLAELPERPAVLLEQRLDLLGEALGIELGGTQKPGREQRMTRQQ